MKKFIVNENDKDKRFDRFITKAAPKLPKTLMYKYLRTKRIKLNGKKAEISTRLNVGDVVEAYIGDEFFEPVIPTYDFLSSPAEIDVVYEDENILLVNKPQGLLCHPDKTEYRDTLIGRIQHKLYKEKKYDPQSENSFKPALCNRIDRNTSGIVIAAKNAQALKIMCAKIKDREVDKRYLCMVHGKTPEKCGMITGYLAKNEVKNKVSVRKKAFDGAKEARSRYRLIATKNDISLVEVELLTGRTHQIRAQMASIGNPLCGDSKYGLKNDSVKGIPAQALCAYKLSFYFSCDAGILDYLNGKVFCLGDIPFGKNLFAQNYSHLIKNGEDINE